MPRLSFSQRMGLTPKEFSLQVDSLDKATRMDIWNAFYQSFDSLKMSTLIWSMENTIRAFCETLWADFFKKDLSELQDSRKLVDQIRVCFNTDKWYIVLNLCEFIIQIPTAGSKKFGKNVNTVFENDNVAYRVIGLEIAPITNDQEIQAITTAMELPDKLSGARTHISTALQLLSDRGNPDYRNSIKESISAVEAVCMVLVGDESASLGKALKHLEDSGIKIHPSLKSGFSSIYGYTSDQGGIRHAMIEEGTVVTQEDALFMLVSCSAFCHYLQQKGTQAGILS